MNDITLLRDAGPDAPPLQPAALSTARAALLDEIERSGTVRGRVRARLPRRRTALRIGAGVTVAAVAWTAAVVIAAPDELGPPPSSVTLVAFEPPAFPLSLDPAPPGLTPSFSADPGGILHAGYSGAGDDSISVRIEPDEPEQYDVSDTEDVAVNGQDAELVTGSINTCTGPGPECIEVQVPYVHLVWERRDGQWVQLSGEGRYGDADRLRELAANLVDRPQPVPLQIHLAPVGWSVEAYKDDRILTLVNDSYEQQTVNVFLPLPEDVVPADALLGELMGPVGPVIPATINGRPAQLVQIGGGPMDSGWYLQAQFTDGTTFVVQAPAAFTQEEVLRFAAEVTYTP
jgi:hypothetical protein